MTRVGLVLPTLAAAQFVMLLDSSVMNVAIATVAKDVGTTVTGIQTAITLYTLVMAMFMVTGGKLGSMYGRKRIFMIGCIVYGLGSLTTALAPNLPVLLFGWSFLEGIGAAMILPAVVALVAANVPAEGRPKAFGLVMGAGAIAVALGPLIGGFATTYFSWRWVFVGEVVVVVFIVFLARRMGEPPRADRVPLDVIGATLLAIGLGLAVYGVLRSSEWGWVIPRPGGPSVLGVSPSICLIVLGGLIVWAFFEWEAHLIAQGREPLVRPSIFRYREMNAGLTMFFVQYLVQAGVFFTIPLFLSVALGLSALETGVRILPLSIALLAGAVGIPRFFPRASPRLVVRLGVLAMLAGTLVLILALEPGRGGGDCHNPVTADRSWHWCPRFTARCGHRVGRSRQAKRRGGRSPEHRDQPRRRHRYGTRWVDSDRSAHDLVPHQRHGESEHPGVGQEPGQCPARGRDTFHVRRGPPGCARSGWSVTRRRNGGDRGQRPGTRRRTTIGPQCLGTDRPVRPFLRARYPEGADISSRKGLKITSSRRLLQQLAHSPPGRNRVPC